MTDKVYYVGMKCVAELKVRSYECDSYNHVNNSVYLNYLEYGRMEYLHSINFSFKAVIVVSIPSGLPSCRISN